MSSKDFEDQMADIEFSLSHGPEGFDFDINNAITDLEFVLGEYNNLKEEFLDVLNQSCAEWSYAIGEENKFLGYDSKCISSYQSALQFSLDHGWIKPEEFLR